MNSIGFGCTISLYEPTNYIRFYNDQRPHQNLDYATPAEVYFGLKSRRWLSIILLIFTSFWPRQGVHFNQIQFPRVDLFSIAPLKIANVYHSSQPGGLKYLSNSP